jgi:hypothetical protein
LYCLSFVYCSLHCLFFVYCPFGQYTKDRQYNGQ